MGGRGGSSGLGGYTSFPDEASSGWDYHGSGQEQVDFFMGNSNVDSLIDGMEPEDRSAFRRWAEGSFMMGQQYQGWDNMTSLEKERTQRYDDVLDRATLSKGVVLTRRSDTQLILGAGRKTATLEELKAMKGQTITSKGSMSFGAAKHGLTIGDDSKNIEYKLHIKGGTKGSGMWIGDKRINGWGAKQREFMTNRDIALKVGNAKYDAKRDIYVVDLYYEGRMAHDYGTSGRVKY